MYSAGQQSCITSPFMAFRSFRKCLCILWVITQSNILLCRELYKLFICWSIGTIYIAAEKLQSKNYQNKHSSGYICAPSRNNYQPIRCQLQWINQIASEGIYMPRTQFQSYLNCVRSCFVGIKPLTCVSKENWAKVIVLAKEGILEDCLLKDSL